MRLSKLISLVLACALCLACLPAARAEGGPVLNLWDSVYTLLFETDNVTADGEASFSLDGEHFKTASLHYVQDNSGSLYDLKLLTPKADGSQRETGWTIVADPEGLYYVMERYYPGTYRIGSDEPVYSLLRRSVQLDAIVNMGSLLAEQMDQLLPQGTVSTETVGDAEQVHIVLEKDQIPEMLKGALNLAAVYLSDRWFYYGHDRSYTNFYNDEEAPTFENFATVTEALAAGTVFWGLEKADVRFTIDAENCLTAMEGEAQAASTFMDGTVRHVTVSFRLNLSEYGASFVPPFYPEDYEVTLADEM